MKGRRSTRSVLDRSAGKDRVVYVLVNFPLSEPNRDVFAPRGTFGSSAAIMENDSPKTLLKFKTMVEKKRNQMQSHRASIVPQTHHAPVAATPCNTHE